MIVTALSELRKAVCWASQLLGVSRPSCTRARVLPWSATAQLNLGENQYWVKVSTPGASAVESAILATARRHGVAAVPLLVASSLDLNAVVLEHVPGGTKVFRFTDLHPHLTNVQAALRTSTYPLPLPALSAQGCAETILSTQKPWCLTTLAQRSLTDALAASADTLAWLDTAVLGTGDVVHGDLHPGNVIAGQDGPVLIDWGDAAYGAPVWDQAVFEAASRRPELRGDPQSMIFDVLAGLKEVADFLSTPAPSAGQTYSVSPPRLVRCISQRATALADSLNRCSRVPADPLAAVRSPKASATVRSDAG